MKLEGLSVERAELGIAFNLWLEERKEVSIYTPFTLTFNGISETIVPSQIFAGSGRMIDLIGLTLERFDIGSDGSLSLSVGPALIHVAPDPDYEAWTVVAPDGELVVGGPGSRVSRFDARSS